MMANAPSIAVTVSTQLCSSAGYSIPLSSRMMATLPSTLPVIGRSLSGASSRPISRRSKTSIIAWVMFSLREPCEPKCYTRPLPGSRPEIVRNRIGLEMSACGTSATWRAARTRSALRPGADVDVRAGSSIGFQRDRTARLGDFRVSVPAHSLDIWPPVLTLRWEDPRQRNNPVKGKVRRANVDRLPATCVGYSHSVELRGGLCWRVDRTLGARRQKLVRRVGGGGWACDRVHGVIVRR